jgi:AcrR family transcriptional regulator
MAGRVKRRIGRRDGAATRKQLVAAARQTIEQEGLQALRWRDVASQVNVSPGAPYRHFKHGPPELVAAVATEGFRDLVDHLAAKPTAADPLDRIMEVSLRYVQFGTEKPHLYRALFSPTLADPLEHYREWAAESKIDESTYETYDGLADAKRHAFMAIVEPLHSAQEAGVVRLGRVDEYGLAVAALVHGLVGEFIDEGLAGRESRGRPWSPTRRAMSRRIIELLVSGLTS